MHLLKYVAITALFCCSFANGKTIAVYVQPPIADAECAYALRDVLSRQYTVKLLNHQTLTNDNLSNTDCLAFPGGLEDVDNFYTLLADKIKVVQNFISHGGAYLGICMGAYLADNDYFDILKDVRVQQYITRPKADFRKEESTIIPIRWYKNNHYMYFYDGPVFVGNLNNCKIIATYSNTDAMAIVQNKIGLVGCHLESKLDWYDTNKLKPFWHKEEHHKLLLDFVNLLLN